LLATTAQEDSAYIHTTARSGRARGSLALIRSGVRIRLMDDPDLERILELRKNVRWSADPRAFGLLRGIGEARWAIAEAGEKEGGLAGMVGAVPLGEVGILCHLAVHHGYRGNGLGTKLSSWAVSYLRSRGASVIRLDATHQAKKLYGSLGFEPISRRMSYRLEGAVLNEWSRKARSRGVRSRTVRLRENGLRIGPLVFGDLPELYGIDRWSFGADRAALIRATLRLHPGWGLIARDASDRIKGYLIRSAYNAGTRIGPFMAAEPVIARSLLARSLVCPLTANGSGFVEVSVPNDGPAHKVLREFGFVGREDRLRMELGEAPRTNGLEIYGTTPYLAT
jgi:ribosomal protein S18 acetylase RimI-like enzyme